MDLRSPSLCYVIRPYTVREMPGWGRLIDALGINGIDNTNPRWRLAPTVLARGKAHGYLMELDLSDDLERCTYFVGRYYDLDIQLLLDVLLKPGNTFLDIGANVGMTTLHGASRVTNEGRVIAFEPQPACCRKIKRHLELNSIRHVTLHNVGLADKDQELTLAIPGGGTIMAHVQTDPAPDVANIRVPIRCGDDFVRDVKGNLTIKIDVEGYELYALRGLIDTIAKYQPPIIIEFCRHYFQRAGTNEGEVMRFFEEQNYEPYEISLRKPGIFNSAQLALHKARAPLKDNADFLWLPGNDMALRAAIATFLR
jgi:FkbM family methyltransferase